MNAPRVGVVGVGRFGQHHARIYAELPGCKLYGVYDIDAARAREIAELNGCLACASYDELLDNIDALSVVTPTASHYEIAEKALRRGVHVLVEKPITTDYEAAAELCDLAKREGLFIASGLLERFNPAFAAIRGRVKSPRTFRAERIGVWAGREVNADVVMDLMIHDIDLLGLVDPSPIVSIEARGSALRSAYFDAAYIRLRLESGLAAELTANRAGDRRLRRIEIHGESAAAADMLDQRAFEAESGPDASQWRPIRIDSAEPLREELSAFLAALCGESTPICTGREALLSLERAIPISRAVSEE